MIMVVMRNKLYWRFIMNKFIITSFCLSLYVASAPIVLANEDTQTRRVAYGDLDLGSEAGQKTLDRRLARAVDAVCGSPNSADLDEVRSIAKCRKTAWQGTRMQVALATVSAKRRLASYDDRSVRSVRTEARR